MKRFLRSLCLIWAGCALAIGLSSSSSAAEFSVNSYDDVADFLPVDGVCSIQNPDIAPRVCTLRAAIQEANYAPGPDVVLLQSGTYKLSVPGINEDYAATGDLDVFDFLTIRGVSADATIIDGAGIDRVFDVSRTIEVTLEKLTVTGGAAFGSKDFSSSLGGGVLVMDNAFLRLYYARVTDNDAVSGGGIGGWGAGEIEILYSEISHNRIRSLGGYASIGGAVHLEPYGTSPIAVELMSSTISYNSCLSTDGASCLGGMVLPVCGDGPGTGLLATNSTISSNEGIGLYIKECTGFLENNTIYGNSAYGIFITDTEPSTHPVSARNTIFAHNGITDCNLATGEWHFRYGSNLSSDNSCDLNPTAIDKINTDPQLYSLGTYGPIPPAIVPTHAPRWGSPVIDNGDHLATVTNDQESYPRPMDGNKNGIASHDMGAIEVVPCVAEDDLYVRHTTVTHGVRQACNRLIVGPNVAIDGTSVAFLARDSVAINGSDIGPFRVTSGTVLSVTLARWAGRPL